MTHRSETGLLLEGSLRGLPFFSTVMMIAVLHSSGQTPEEMIVLMSENRKGYCCPG
ncbi:Putative pol protein [Caligus rogercresseyi]|uniref:Pol protein n=1 Tax=Caligus rogercresseyi TaxID=217165 RepID=A0A7T8KAD3_CALRO|nr:Putative pol protein [Caligus rogercresseyi]